MRNLTDQAEDAAALAVGLNLRSPVNLNRGQLDWFTNSTATAKRASPWCRDCPTRNIRS